MYWTLALRHVLVRPGRALMLLTGYALGVAVMIVLLSVGDAMLDQSRDATLIGGGELTALPEGVDIEALRTGGLAGMFFGINGARFVSRELIGGPRHAGMVAAVSPTLEQKLLLVHVGDAVWTVRAGGEIPSAATAVGAGLPVIAGRWTDQRQDSAWRAPDPQTLYDEMDRFHRAPAHDSSWAEWDYFNIVRNDREWWYITLLVGGGRDTPRAGGQVLVTRRQPDGRYQRFVTSAGADVIRVDTTRADLAIGTSVVTQRDGSYHVSGASGAATFDFTLRPNPHQYFPPVDVGSDEAPSGYVVPALTATASGRLCVAGSCQQLHDALAYHDHNWGTWHATTWEWGAGRSDTHALLYGGVIPADGANRVPFFLALDDSIGVRQVFRFDTIEAMGQRQVPGMPGAAAPDSFRLMADRLGDTLRVTVRVTDVAGSHSVAAGPGRAFLQMRGRWQATGTAAGVAVTDSGTGFFETWVRESTLDRSPHPMRAHVRHP